MNTNGTSDHSLWAATAALLAPCPELVGPLRAEVVIVGAGYETQFGPELGAQLVATIASGPDLVFELILRHGIACDAVRNGWLQLATSEAALEPLTARVMQCSDVARAPST